MTNTTNAKVTIKDRFSEVKAFLVENGASAEMVAFIEDRAEKSVRKSSSNGKPTARQLENKALSDIIFDYLSENEPTTITGLTKAIPELNGLNTQRVTPLVARDSRFVATKVGKSNCYTIAR